MCNLAIHESRFYSHTHAAAKSRAAVARLFPNTRADDVVGEELGRLRLRTPGLSDEQFADIARSMRRVVATLLHTPTVRMKEFAVDPGGDRYAAALHALFDLDPSAVAALTSLNLADEDGAPSA